MNQVELTSRLIDRLAEYFPLKSDFERAIAEIKGGVRVPTGKAGATGLSQFIRGMAAARGISVNPATVNEDRDFFTRALTTGTTPGSYLVPTLQANEIIEFLTNSGVARRAGVRVWQLPGVDKINIPTAAATPTVEWLGQNTAQTATDPNLGQISFSMKTARCLTAIPNELLQVSTPTIDNLLAELIGVAFAEAEDTALFSTTTVSGGPSALYPAAGTTVWNTGNSANGGNLAYTDITAALWKSSGAKARAPFCWFMSPRTFFQRVVGLVDGQSRPIYVPANGGLSAAVNGYLFGYPVYVSPAIPENQALGSGTNQSFAVLTNPRYIHIGDSQAVEIQISTEFLFDKNQTAIRGVHRCDFAYGPVAGIVLVKGVN